MCWTFFFTAELEPRDFIKGEPLSMSPTRSEQEEACTRLMGRIKSRCLGLLEISPSAGLITASRVSFLHKSVSDFLDTDNARQAITQYLGDKSFIPEVPLLHSVLWRLKTCRTRQLGEFAVLKRTEFFDRICPLVRLFMLIAGHAETLTRHSHTDIVNEFDRVVSALWNMVAFKSVYEQLGLIHWTVAPRYAGTLDHIRISKVSSGWTCGLSSIPRRPSWNPDTVTENGTGLPEVIRSHSNTYAFVHYAWEQKLHLYAAANGLKANKTTRERSSSSRRTRNSGTLPLRAAEEI